MKTKWLYDNCKLEALKYNTRTEFQYGSKGAYNSSRVNGWLNELCSHMKLLKHPKGYWTKELCHIEAIKYNNRTDFCTQSSGAYNYSKRNGFLDEICIHMINIGNRYKKCIYVYEFSDNCAYIGLTYNLEKRHSDRKKFKKDQVTKHIKKTSIQPIRKQLTDYINVDEAIKLEGFYVEFYKNNGWQILNVAKTGSIGNGIIKWTKEECYKEALKYKSRTDFKCNSISAYNSSKNHKWLNDVCSHMIDGKKPNGYWTKMKCEDIASKYNNSTLFKADNKELCAIAYKNGWMGDICSHMVDGKKPNGYWTFEHCKEVALNYTIRSSFKKASSGYDSARKNGWLDEICSHMIK